jgi:hypothetical protein
MARGWESKSVEDQINEKEASAEPGKHRVTAKAVEREGKQAALRAARNRTANAMNATRNQQRREFLQKALDDLDRQLSEKA